MAGVGADGLEGQAPQGDVEVQQALAVQAPRVPDHCLFVEYWDEAKCDLILQDATSDLKFLWRTHKVPREAQARLAAFGFFFRDGDLRKPRHR